MRLSLIFVEFTDKNFCLMEPDFDNIVSFLYEYEL